MVVACAIVIPFAMRGAPPGMRHDWLWPAQPGMFYGWFQNGLSAWYPNGFGAAQDSPTVDLPLLFFSMISATGANSELTLAIALIIWFSLAQYGVYSCLRLMGARLGKFPMFSLGAVYAFGPVAFQKLVAGHLYYLCAYALLPFFVACVIKAIERQHSWWRYAVLAGLLLSVMSAQIQFVGFCCIVAAAFAVSSDRPGRALLQCAPIVMIGLLHNVVLIANLALPAQTQGLIAQHATYQWEIDLSTSLRKALLLSGYVGYDQRSLNQIQSIAYLASKCALVTAAAAGVVYGIRHAAVRRPVVAASIVAVFALAWATGLFGPFAPIFTASLYRSPLFTLVREFYHVMALYAVALTFLAGFGLLLLPRKFHQGAAAVLLFATLPFVCGLERQIPTVPASLQSSSMCANVSNLCGLLPLDEPIGMSNTAGTFGRDQAALTTQAGGAENGPLFVHYAVSATDFAPLLSDLGFDSMAWRNGVISRLPNNYEPNVGAAFRGFLSSQRLLEARFRKRKAFAARAIATVESEGSASVLDAVLPDSRLPAGQELPFSYSFDNNDIRKSWVSSRMWYWAYPELLNTSGVPVFTRSQAALQIALPKRAGFLYVLAKASSIECNFQEMTPLPVASPSVYRWYKLLMPGNAAQARLVLRGGQVRAVARVVLSGDGSWKPAGITPLRQSPLPVAISYRSPSFYGAVPSTALPQDAVLVLARTYSPELHLFVNGMDRGAASRVHGFFDEWKLQRSDRGASFRISSVYQRRSDLLNGIAGVICAILLLVAIPWRRPGFVR